MGACSPPPPVEVTRDRSAPIQTDRLQYVARRAYEGVEFSVPFTYTNRSADTVFLPNCRVEGRPDLDMALQKRVRGQWHRVWGSGTLLCLSPPVVIAPGKTYTDTLEVFGGTSGKQVYPELEVREVEGEYRLVWTQLHTGFDSEPYPQGDTLPLDAKVSNPFTLKVGWGGAGGEIGRPLYTARDNLRRLRPTDRAESRRVAGSHRPGSFRTPAPQASCARRVPRRSADRYCGLATRGSATRTSPLPPTGELD
jgi:hypothetical protein